jgi:hypothetical protein
MTIQANSDLSADLDLIVIDDDCYLHILKFMLSQGFESYLLPESKNLSFGKTHNDVFINSHQ